MKPPIRILPTSLMAMAMLAMIAVTTAQAQTDLEPRIVLRPVTAVDTKTYNLPDDTDYSGGLSTIGKGAPAYLEVEVSSDFPASNIVSVTWVATNSTTHSAVALQASPLGTNVPIYEPSDRLIYQVAQPGGRTVLRPPDVGQYTVQATITTTTGTTNLTQTITAATYYGIPTCTTCHSGGILAPDKYSTWVQTLHSRVFADQIDAVAEFEGHSSMRESCLKCHTTGYDDNTNAVNGGFDDVAAQYGWTIPTNLVVGNWAAMLADSNYVHVANLANVQCESCHGPGGQHALDELMDPRGPEGKAAISVNYTSGTCQQCHDDADHHPYGTEWLNSLHAITTRHPSGAGEEDCVRCHTGLGFIQYADGVTNNIDPTYLPINCQACHEPHGETIPDSNPHQIRLLASVTFEDGTVVTNGGEGRLCMNCHHSRQNAATYATTYHSHFGPHHGPQGDMLEGINGFTYGESIPSSAHAHAVPNTCVTCHMQDISSSDPAWLHAGGHTFEINWEAGDVDLVGACQQCHGPAITDFDFPLQDYNGDGVIEGVQTEVQSLLDQLSELLPPDHSIKSSLSVDSSWSAPQLEAAYDWMFVEEDGSMGIHNTAYAIGLLKASIANLTGKPYTGPLTSSDLAYYDWQTNYFADLSTPEAAPNYINNSSGIPNWMMANLGLNPFSDAEAAANGVFYFNGKNIINGATNTITIYTAAEIAFNSQTNSTYVIQGISAVSGGIWQDVSTNIPGTGGTISYLTPTRNNAQMFFRVITSPSP